LDRADDIASKADNRFPVRRLMLQKNRRFHVPVFLPSMWAGKKFPSCAHQCKRFPRSLGHGSPVRDTSSRWAAKVRAFSCEKAKHSQSLMHRRNSSSEFGRDAAPRRPVGTSRRRPSLVLYVASCALNPEGEAATSNAAYIHKRGVGILE